MATSYYGIIAVRSAQNPITHHYHISHVFIIYNNGNGFECPGRLYTKLQAIKLLQTSKIYTLTWDYSTARWRKGAEVSTENVRGIEYLRSLPDSTQRDNLTNLIDYDFFSLT